MPPASPTVPREGVFVQSSDCGPERGGSSICCSSEEESPNLIKESELQNSERSSQTPSRVLFTKDELISPVPTSPEVNPEHNRGFLFISPPRWRRNMQALDDGSFSNQDGEEMVGNPFEIDSPAPVGVPRIGWSSVSTLQQPLEDSPVPTPADVRKLRRESFGLRCDCDDAEPTNDACIIFGGDTFQNSTLEQHDEAPVLEQPWEEHEPLSPHSGTSNLHADYNIPNR